MVSTLTRPLAVPDTYPTGIVVASSRSAANSRIRITVSENVRAKLAEAQNTEHADKISDIKGVQMKIEWAARSVPMCLRPIRWLRIP